MSDRWFVYRRTNRLGQRFMWSAIGVFAAVATLVAVSAQQMFIASQDLGVLLWILAGAGGFAVVTSYFLSRPIARDASRISEAAGAVAVGDLDVRTGVVRDDELGDAAHQFDLMVARLRAVETERALMLSSVSHDLRTPLAALRASIEAIRDGVAEDPAASLKGMESQVHALGALVDDLSLHTRLASGTIETEMRRVDLTELVDEVVEQMRPIAVNAGVEVEMTATDHLAVDGDQGQLGRAIRNLIDNAIRHTPTGTSVRVAVEAADGEAVVSVSDEGPGFPAGLRAFDAFTRGDPARDVRTGTAGLGLAIAKGIVERHDGTIAIVESRLQPGGGGVEVRLGLSDRRMNAS